ncbi:hypothetical protein C1645_872492 [Glomus cerebriforme]|uniref:Uncharacterized protein n=1 Tax=Glomus cerebriforme TaxID=658196 RepID=A0A397TG23_9GLOM|nr:hypothetical protein C1645_872492 [Glomus cerebriforme]
MQSTSIQDFSANSKRRLELQNQHNPQLQQLQQQQLQQQQTCDDMIEEPPFKKQRPGVATNFIYKLSELAAYTSAIASDAINTLTGGGTVVREPTRHTYDYDDVLQIKTDDEDDDENDSYDNKLDKKNESAWTENVEEEEPPPPYDNSWSMPSPSVTTTPHDKLSETKQLTTPALSSSPSQQVFAAPQQPLTSQKIVTTNTSSRRRQFRVRRGRRFLRRKSSSMDMSNNTNTSSTSTSQPENNNHDDDDIFLKFNCKLADMIAEGRAALTSKVDVTDVEMMLAEEKEREERIMKELGIQTPISRRARRLTNSSTSSDYDYYSSVLSSGGHSSQSSTSSFCDNGFNGGINYYSSPTSYSVDNGFSSNRSTIGRSSPAQFVTPGGFNFSNGSSGYSYFGGSPSTGSPTTSRYEGSNHGFGPSLHNFGQHSAYGTNSGFSSNWISSNNRNYY